LIDNLGTRAGIRMSNRCGFYYSKRWWK